ncbi:MULTISPECIES: protocatechuate 3,4-dioxygenase subunit alpha [unclassified Sphingomonas]|uniref:protocatechuate 3,4-dioxygenase subunit alpha n=1 Tax=unclassified Sphingomonas TaxID=196159 RepID=UPI0006FA5FBB|nr:MULTISPECIES: protocatechuate 3,4-dioxygenase subunit alpha [unclassified Sphingomonas]KQM62279.1 protocatechuate 3,4-dioxygenase subunit alpha [Sphingomonas sp. Leaf16]KQN13683.1 protocatechuate 3,4-dioxygenase subunit alpha [Sphingomonas sp. Leaf29]KQN23087.1 protocatechuate 3,4-dioxygenase subunit alpha [Sphingomonas sp. Leaf32]
MTIDVAAREPAPRQDNQDPALFGQTPSQTVGPFFHYGLPWKGGADLVGQSDMGARPDLFPAAHYVLNLPSPRATPEGEAIRIAGRVLDADGQPVVDAMVELWQADAQGRYGTDRDPAFVGFGRSSTDEDGVWRFRTVRPGRIDADQAPHVALAIFGRGLLKRLATRLYFADGAGNDRDPVLAVVPPDRRATLIATRRGDDWWLDIVLGGAGETVFFDL